MELITIKHKDFTLYVECTKFDDVWTNAERNISAEALTSVYSWTDGVEYVRITNVDGDTTEIEKDSTSRAIFFDNTDYPIWVDFNNDVKNARFGSQLQGDNDRFTFHRHTLAG